MDDTPKEPLGDFFDRPRYRDGILVYIALSVRNKGGHINKNMPKDKVYLRSEIRKEAMLSFDALVTMEEADAIIEFLLSPHSMIPVWKLPPGQLAYYDKYEEDWHHEVMEHVRALNKLGYYEPKEASNG